MSLPDQTVVDGALRQFYAANPQARPPYNLTSEAAVLGAILWDRDALTLTATTVQPADFFESPHGVIYAAMLACSRRGVAPDRVTVQGELTRRGQLEAAGGVAKLDALMGERCIPVNVEHYARMVARDALMRRLITAGWQIMGLGYTAEYDPQPVLAAAGALLAGVRTGLDAPAVRLSEVVETVMDDLAERMRTHQGAGIPTGFPALDTICYGWEPGQLILLAARTARGKTAMAQHFAEAAGHAGAAVAMLSLEMEPPELARRHLAREGETDLGVLRRAQTAGHDMHRLLLAQSRLSALPIYFLQVSEPTIAGVQTAVQRLQADPLWGCRLLIVDYLQLMQGRTSGGNREQEVAAISRGLKQLARTCQIPVIALSQFSRAAEDSGQPELRHLRESGALEQDASIVLALHQPDPTMPQRIELHVLKQRDGESNAIVQLHWHGSQQRFREVD